MTRLRKIGNWAVLLVVLLVTAQLSVSFALRTRRIHGYLIAHLERTFGRPVQVGEFSAQILPIPRLDMEGVTVVEDPGFGAEYFLRAESMRASLRWMGLLRGQFEFGTMSLTRPSLILVRNVRGQWNLEGWLPPVASKATDGHAAYGPQPAEHTSNYLQKIEFEEGRINFKTGDEKRPFAFTDVTGSVEQVGPGRWRLKLQAKPWRSGVILQSAGILYASGDVAGTSARLQPAQVQVHWDKVSLADLFRLATGNDFGVRGEFGFDGTASMGAGEGGKQNAVPGRWKFDVQARALQVHRWDLTERNDNPRVSVQVKGVWDLWAREARAEEMSVDLPHSNIRGAGEFGTAADSSWRMNIESAAVEGQDILAWYRAFGPGVAEGLGVEQFFTGKGVVRGWPVRWEEGQLASEGGIVRVPELAEVLRVGVVRGGLKGNVMQVEPVRISVSAAAKTGKIAAKGRELQNWAEIRFSHDVVLKSGGIRADGHLDQPSIFFKTAAAVGKTVNHGWELGGGVSSAMEWNWDGGIFRNGRWNGSLHFLKAELQAAGLNLPMELDDARMEWKAGRKSATIASGSAFGAAWSGTIGEERGAGDGEVSGWKFQLHADHLDATEFDRWVGPRARPNWLQRLLPSLLGNANAGGKPSELLRRVSAEGEITADAVSVEKIKLSKARAKVSLQDLQLKLRDVEAQWAGGTVRGAMDAVFRGTPKYEITAQIERANLTQLPLKAGWTERWNGLASGSVHLTTAGVGRDELLAQIAGRGDVRFKNVEFRGWDVAESLESGAPKTGASRWGSGEGEFAVKDRGLSFEAIQLDGAGTKLWLTGSLGFAKEVSLTFRAMAVDGRGMESGAEARVLRVSGPPETPKVTVQTVSAVQPNVSVQ